MTRKQQRAAAAAPAALAHHAVATFVLGIAPGRIRALCGLQPAELRQLLENREQSDRSRLAIFVELPRTRAPEEIAEAIAAALAQAALASWPHWWGADFGSYRSNALEMESARLRLADMPARVPEISEVWARRALALAHRGDAPRVSDCPREIELAQLSLAINPAGLVLVLDAPPVTRSAAAFVQGVEWTARQAGAAVVVLFPEWPSDPAPFQRILFGAEIVALDPDPAAEMTREPRSSGFWLAPAAGRPHPSSQIEQSVAAALRRDAELQELFCFNQLVRTVRGSRPRVDLLWREGRLVVELDGYADHNSRAAFARDRHRDYELVISGYTVLRLANDEIAQDMGRALEKIRDLVRLRRASLT